MVTFVSAAAFLLGAASVSGKYLSHTRYEWYYGSYSKGKFFQNDVLTSDSDSRSWATYPSENEVNILPSVNFPVKSRMAETHVFTGVIRLPKCKAGVYKFRVTSDDDSTLLINNEIVTSNPGSHAMLAAVGTTTLHASHDIPFELWWGNYGGVSGLKLEFCHHAVATQRIKKQLGSIDASGEANKLLAKMDAEELDSFHCHMTTDLSLLLAEHDVPTVRRCDFEGYFADDLKFFQKHSPSTKHSPTGCVEEVGGRISGWDRSSWTYSSEKMSFEWQAMLSPQASGQHTFWATCDDACYIEVYHADGRRTEVVAIPNDHDPLTRHGNVFLKKGELYTMKFYWGNYYGYGEFKLQYQGPMMTQPSTSFSNILV